MWAVPSAMSSIRKLDCSWYRTVIQRHHGNKTAAKWMQYITDLFSVTCGVKRAWLIDYFAPNAEKLQNCSSEVFQVFDLASTNVGDDTPVGDVCIVSLNEDLMFWNVKEVIIACQSLLQLDSKHQPSVQDVVETTVPKFTVLSQNGEFHLASHKEFEEIIQELLTVVNLVLRELLPLAGGDKCYSHYEKSGNKQFPSKVLIPLVKLNIPAHINMCTVFGWLIGYPVVYWFSTSILDTFDSSLGLSMVPLLCYKVTCCHGNGHTSLQKADKMDENIELYSFSIPEHLAGVEIESGYFHSWFEMVRTKCCVLFKFSSDFGFGLEDIEMTISPVCLPSVNL